MRRTILALGDHGFGPRPPDRAVCELLLRLARDRDGARPRPRVCLVALPDERASERAAAFYSHFGVRACEPSDVSPLRPRRPGALRDLLLSQDLLYVAGGGHGELMALCEARGLGELLTLAWRRGVVLAGQGAGAGCWFEAAIDAGGAAVPGLGLLGGSLCVRYGDSARRAAYLAAVRDGAPGGYGLVDHAALLWEGTGPPTALTARRGGRAFKVGGAGGGVVEDPLPARVLSAPAPAAPREDIAEFRRIAAIRRRAGWLG